jgi:hypothetical protein
MPAPPTTKLQIFYNYKARGFSEILWSTLVPSGVLDPNGSVTGRKVDNYLAKRLPMLNNECEVVYARASLVGSPRQFQIRSFLGQGKVGTGPGKGSAPDDVILCKMFGPSGQQGVIHLHAFPSAIVKANVITDLGAYAGLLGDFGNYMVGNAPLQNDGWVINTSISSAPGPRTYFPVGVATASLPRGFFVGQGAGPAYPVFPPGTVLSFSNMGNNQFGFNGRKIVLHGDATGFQVGGATPVGTAQTPGGRFFVVPSAAVPISQFIPFELSERKCGKVFGVPAGRRRNTLSLRR